MLYLDAPASGMGPFSGPDPTSRFALASSTTRCSTRFRFVDRSSRHPRRGIDARAFRLEWPRGARLFEVDRADVYHADKRAVLSRMKAAPSCESSRRAARSGAAVGLALVARARSRGGVSRRGAALPGRVGGGLEMLDALGGPRPAGLASASTRRILEVLDHHRSAGELCRRSSAELGAHGSSASPTRGLVLRRRAGTGMRRVTGRTRASYGRSGDAGGAASIRGCRARPHSRDARRGLNRRPIAPPRAGSCGRARRCRVRPSRSLPTIKAREWHDAVMEASWVHRPSDRSRPAALLETGVLAA